MSKLKKKPLILEYYEFNKEHEVFLDEKQNEPFKLKCLICGSELLCSIGNSGGQRTWRDHIRWRHPNVYKEYRQRSDEEKTQNICRKIMTECFDFDPQIHDAYFQKKHEIFKLKCLYCEALVSSSIWNKFIWKKHVKEKHPNVFEKYQHCEDNENETSKNDEETSSNIREDQIASPTSSSIAAYNVDERLFNTPRTSLKSKLDDRSPKSGSSKGAGQESLASKRHIEDRECEPISDELKRLKAGLEQVLNERQAEREIDEQLRSFNAVLLKQVKDLVSRIADLEKKNDRVEELALVKQCEQFSENLSEPAVNQTSSKNSTNKFVADWNSKKSK